MSGGAVLDWKGRTAVRAGLPVLRALASTWRYQLRNEQALDGLRARGTPFIFSLWHGQLLPLMWLHRDEGIRVMISEHRDGEMIARVAEALGFETVRGSTSRGGERALLGLSRALQGGEEVAVTPDGPRGPPRISQPGALIAAARARAPILPISMHPSSAWRFRSWDSFMVPRPFACVTVAYGEPLSIEAASAREAAAQSLRLDQAMRDTEAHAAR